MTFSVVAVSQSGTQVGVATASFSLAVGASVPALAPGIGAVVTQAWTKRSHRARSLELMRRSLPPSRVLEQLADEDEGWSRRQVGLIDVGERTAVWTGPDTSPWAGAIEGPNFVVIGNLLPGREVLEAMEEVMLSSMAVAFSDRLLAALAAGQDAGGDVRGRQSASLQVVSNAAPDAFPPDNDVDLRCDDHADPVAELARLLALTRSGDVMTASRKA